jgi:hypothetical protein
MKIFHLKLNHPFVAEDGNMFLQNFGIHLQEYVMSLSRFPQTWYKNLYLYSMVAMYLCLLFSHDDWIYLSSFGKVSVVVLGKLKKVFLCSSNQQV